MGTKPSRQRRLELKAARDDFFERNDIDPDEDVFADRRISTKVLERDFEGTFRDDATGRVGRRRTEGPMISRPAERRARELDARDAAAEAERAAARRRRRRATPAAAGRGGAKKAAAKKAPAKKAAAKKAPAKKAPARKKAAAGRRRPGAREG